MTINPKGRLPMVESMLNWAFRSGYDMGYVGAKQYADAHGLGLLVEAGLLYADRLAFFDSPELAGEAIRMAGAYKYTRVHEPDQDPKEVARD